MTKALYFSIFQLLLNIACKYHFMSFRVPTLSQATRKNHLGFSLNIPGTSTATVIGLQAGASYTYALYQYSSDARWVGHKSSLNINGGSIFTTSITGGSDPTAKGSFVAKSDGTAEFLFTRRENEHTVFSGLSVSKICAGLTEMSSVIRSLVSSLFLCASVYSEDTSLSVCITPSMHTSPLH